MVWSATWAMEPYLCLTWEINTFPPILHAISQNKYKITFIDLDQLTTIYI